MAREGKKTKEGTQYEVLNSDKWLVEGYLTCNRFSAPRLVSVRCIVRNNCLLNSFFNNNSTSIF